MGRCQHECRVEYGGMVLCLDCGWEKGTREGFRRLNGTVWCLQCGVEVVGIPDLLSHRQTCAGRVPEGTVPLSAAL
jgi:hypothetical protein